MRNMYHNTIVTSKTVSHHLHWVQNNFKKGDPDVFLKLKTRLD